MPLAPEYQALLAQLADMVVLVVQHNRTEDHRDPA